jgi:hypothetical protein
VIYFLFLCGSLILVTFEATLPPPTQDTTPYTDRSLLVDFFTGAHTMFVNPVVTFLGGLAFVAQARFMLSTPSRQALSVTGLTTQAIVFSFVGISWIFRLRLSHERYTSGIGSSFVGWAAVNNLVFALVQALLLVVMGWRTSAMNVGPESAPLLGGQL